MHGMGKPLILIQLNNCTSLGEHNFFFLKIWQSVKKKKNYKNMQFLRIHATLTKQFWKTSHVHLAKTGLFWWSMIIGSPLLIFTSKTYPILFFLMLILPASFKIIFLPYRLISESLYQHLQDFCPNFWNCLQKSRFKCVFILLLWLLHQ